MIKLKLPPTIMPLSTADLDEYLAGWRAQNISEEHLTEISHAVNNEDFSRIVEGYKVVEMIDKPFNIFAEINIDNDNLWNLFKTMMMAMPEEISLILSHKDDKEVSWGEYQSKYNILNILDPHYKQLSEDPYINFGVINQTEDYLEEIFVHHAKYIQYWGMDREKLMNKMHKYSIYEVKNIKFIDNFPMVSRAYQHVYEDVTTLPTQELINRLRKYTTYEEDEQ